MLHAGSAAEVCSVCQGALLLAIQFGCAKECECLCCCVACTLGCVLIPHECMITPAMHAPLTVGVGLAAVYKKIYYSEDCCVSCWRLLQAWQVLVLSCTGWWQLWFASPAGVGVCDYGWGGVVACCLPF